MSETPEQAALRKAHEAVGRLYNVVKSHDAPLGDELLRLAHAAMDDAVREAVEDERHLANSEAWAKADAHYEAKMEAPRNFAEAGVGSAVEADRAARIKAVEEAATRETYKILHHPDGSRIPARDAHKAISAIVQAAKGEKAP